MKDESGFTVVELTVVMALMGIISTILLGFLDQTTTVASRTGSDTQAEVSADIALRRVTEDLRSATNIQPCSTGALYSSCITFYVPATDPQINCPYEREITYSASGTTLAETRTDFAPSPSTCTGTTSVYNAYPVLTNLANDVNHPFLTYYDSSQNAIDVSSAGSCYPSPPSSTACTTAVAVRVTLQVSYTGSSNPLTLSNLVALRNNR